MGNFQWQKIREKASWFSGYTGPEKPAPYFLQAITILVSSEGEVLYGLDYLNTLPPDVMVSAMVAQGEMTEAEAMNYTNLTRFKEGTLSLEEIQNLTINYGNSDSEEEKI